MPNTSLIESPWSEPVETKVGYESISKPKIIPYKKVNDTITLSTESKLFTMIDYSTNTSVLYKVHIGEDECFVISRYEELSDTWVIETSGEVKGDKYFEIAGGNNVLYLLNGSEDNLFLYTYNLVTKEYTFPDVNTEVCDFNWPDIQMVYRHKKLSEGVFEHGVYLIQGPADDESLVRVIYTNLTTWVEIVRCNGDPSGPTDIPTGNECIMVSTSIFDEQYPGDSHKNGFFYTNSYNGYLCFYDYAKADLIENSLAWTEFGDAGYLKKHDGDDYPIALLTNAEKLYAVIKGVSGYYFNSLELTPDIVKSNGDINVIQQPGDTPGFSQYENPQFALKNNALFLLSFVFDKISVYPAVTYMEMVYLPIGPITEPLPYGFTYNNRLYHIGKPSPGTIGAIPNSFVLSKFDPTTLNFVSQLLYNTEPSGLMKLINAYYSCKVVYGDYLYLYGGSEIDGYTAINTMYKINLITNEITVEDTTGLPRMYGGGIGYNNKLYFLGGNTNETTSAPAGIYDLTTKTWSYLPNIFSTDCQYPQMIEKDGNIYFYREFHASMQQSFGAPIKKWNSITNEVNTMNTPPEATYTNYQMFHYDNKVYAMVPIMSSYTLTGFKIFEWNPVTDTYVLFKNIPKVTNSFPNFSAYWTYTLGTDIFMLGEITGIEGYTLNLRCGGAMLKFNLPTSSYLVVASSLYKEFLNFVMSILQLESGKPLADDSKFKFEICSMYGTTNLQPTPFLVNEENDYTNPETTSYDYSGKSQLPYPFNYSAEPINPGILNIRYRFSSLTTKTTDWSEWFPISADVPPPPEEEPPQS